MAEVIHFWGLPQKHKWSDIIDCSIADTYYVMSRMFRQKSIDSYVELGSIDFAGWGIHRAFMTLHSEGGDDYSIRNDGSCLDFYEGETRIFYFISGRFNVVGELYPYPADTYDIGGTIYRWRDLHLSRNAYVAGFVDGASFKVGGVAGVDGTFESADGKTVTVSKGIITSIV